MASLPVVVKPSLDSSEAAVPLVLGEENAQMAAL